jgi:hypothetical protein
VTVVIGVIQCGWLACAASVRLNQSRKYWVTGSVTVTSDARLRHRQIRRNRTIWKTCGNRSDYIAFCWIGNAKPPSVVFFCVISTAPSGRLKSPLLADHL